MLRVFVFAIGFIMVAFAIRFFIDEIMLYKNGVRKEATLILMKPYNHVDINKYRNKIIPLSASTISLNKTPKQGSARYCTHTLDKPSTIAIFKTKSLFSSDCLEKGCLRMFRTF